MKKFKVMAYTVKLFKPNPKVKRNVFAMMELLLEDSKLYLYFVDPGSFIHENTFIKDKRIIKAFLPGENFPYYVDLLRNEKPIFAMFDWDKPPMVVITTGKEVVGEEEARWFKLMEEPVLN